MSDSKTPARDRGLRLVRGGLHRGGRLGKLRLVAAPESAPPFEVEAVVEEEDTHLVLSAPVALPETPEHPIRLMTALLADQGVEPGSVVVRQGRPQRWLAVVHDLSAHPTWREEWVARALENVFSKTRRSGIRSLALPFLGTRHGRLAPERFVDLLRDALRRDDSGLRRLWLILPPGAPEDLSRGLEFLG